jgi:hypothetical protein
MPVPHEDRPPEIRIGLVPGPALEDQAGALLEANSVPGMERAAKELRQTALDVRKMLIGPVSTDRFLQLAPSVPDPESRRIELADLAVDVITAADYLLSLLETPRSPAPRFVLDPGAGSYRGYGPADSDLMDRLNRRRLDSRNTAVRLGMRLLDALHSDVAGQ